MADSTEWLDAGDAGELATRPLQQVRIGRRQFAVSFVDGRFHAIDGRCNHVGGPLGDGTLDPAGYVTCPWHGWKFHCATGRGEPGYEGDAVPSHATKVDGGRLWIASEPSTPRTRLPHEPHPLAKIRSRGEAGGPPADAPLRVLGISTTNMNEALPRYSTSDALLATAIEHAAARGLDTRLIRLSELSFRACEGYYSKSARACTWPCSITQMDPADQMDRVYEGMVAWADVILVATPIRWGAASSLYYRMAERLNCVQNQETIANRHLMNRKVAGFVITGGQDNVQGVAGQLLGFFAELGCQFPQFPYVAHSRGWSAEDMENNVRVVQRSAALHDGARSLVDRCVETVRALLDGHLRATPPARGGRKAHRLDGDEPAREG
ncbi:MAG: NAD(P)H-dependent oxidoreductase [Planctomycetes bacterium]|nr:NAD(P)H-dependent oxidoreductase [Planctomycetota bacterium]